MPMDRKSPYSRSLKAAFATLVPFVPIWAPTNASIEVPEPISFFLDLNCYDCHNDADREGGLDLQNLKFDPNDSASMRTWILIHDRIHDQEMPPKNKKHLWPEADERAKFLSSFENYLHDISDEQQKQRGRVRSRRLNRTEYENTLHDLLGIDIPLKTFLPDDPEQEGFTKIADIQQISYHLLQKYLEAADAALDESFARALRPEPLETRYFEPKDIAVGRERGGNIREPFLIENNSVSYPTALSYHGRMRTTKTPESGWYRIRLRAHAVNAPNGHGVWTSVRSGICYAIAPLMFWIGSFEARAEPEEHEFVSWIQKDHLLEIRPMDHALRRIPGNTITKTGTAPDLKAPGVAVEYLEIERIHKGPPSDQIRQRLFGDLAYRNGKLISANPKKDLDRLIANFAGQAFRRLVRPDELDPYLSFAYATYEQDQSLIQAIQAGYRSILCSPRFLYFTEEAGPLDAYAVASRLSYFLWNRPPDEHLLSAAENGSLLKLANLGFHIERMLNDRRSEAFIENFTDQWLDLKHIDFTTPDIKLYPEFDDTLKHAMLGETHSFVRKLIDENLSVTHIIDSDFAMLNERIARHYGIDGVSGTHFRPVALKPEHRRGGIITQASILKVTANGTTSSPVVRGVWILERILGQHIPLPPDNVPAVEPDIRGATSIRDQLNKHREMESCNSCHVKIDPPGFALESYDVIGGWRERYRALSEKGHLTKGVQIKPSYELTDGESFQDIDGFKEIILREPEQIARNLLQKTLTFATGAGIEFADRREIEIILDKLKGDNYGFRSIIYAAATSSIFLEK